MGCGDGRLASVLTRNFKIDQYSSFDVNQACINYLEKTIGKKYPKFSFVYSDLYHSYYNPAGKLKTETYIFPYKDEKFNIVFLNSIFTHFLPNQIFHYLKEINRVLIERGIIFATYFIANRESVKLDSKNLTSKDLLCGKKSLLNYKYDDYWVRDRDVRERIVIVTENWLRKAYKIAGLKISKVIWGTWCGRAKNQHNTQQDLVIGLKI